MTSKRNNNRLNVKDINDRLKNNFYFEYSQGKYIYSGKKKRDKSELNLKKEKSFISS